MDSQLVTGAALPQGENAGVRSKHATIGGQLSFTGHKTESIYRRYAIVSKADQEAGVAKLAALHALEETSTKAETPVIR